MKTVKSAAFFILFVFSAYFVSAQSNAASNALDELNAAIKKFNETLDSVKNEGGQYIGTVLKNNAAMETKFFLDGQISKSQEIKALVLSKYAPVLNEYDSVCLMIEDANKQSSTLDMEIGNYKRDNEEIAYTIANPERPMFTTGWFAPIEAFSFPVFPEREKGYFMPEAFIKTPSPLVIREPRNMREAPPIRLTPQEEFEISVYKRAKDIVESGITQTQMTVSALKDMNNTISRQMSANEQAIRSNRSTLDGLNNDIDNILSKVAVAYSQTETKKAELAEIQKQNSRKERELIQLKKRNADLREEAKRKGIAPYAVSGQPHRGRVTQAANLRAGPGTSHTILETLPAGTQIFIYSSAGADGFYKVRVLTTGADGYISKSLVELGDVVNEVKEGEGPIQPTGGKTSGAPQIKIFNNTSLGLTLTLNDERYAFIPKEAKTITVPAGRYKFVASVSDPNVNPSIGNQQFDENIEYGWTFYITTRPAP